jgi:FkbM family methyltransferase
MNKLSSLLHRVFTSFRFHTEKLQVRSNYYPQKIMQTKLDKNGIWFEVANLTEANRVRYLDDEGEFLQQLLKEIKEDDVFYDVGACIGIYSLHAAKKSCHVFAFEPDPGFRNHFIVNMEINKMNYINLFPYAIADESKMMYLYTNGVDGKSPSLDNNGFGGKVEVEVHSIDNLVNHLGIPSPSIIKMDIEGAEYLALQGMKGVFRTNLPRLLFLEIHPRLLKKFGSTKGEVVSLLYQNGYQVRYQVQRDEQFHFIFQKSNKI